MVRAVLITPGYAEANWKLHVERPDYGSKVKPLRIHEITEWQKKLKAKTLLDYGCGKGVLGQFVKDVHSYDPAIPKFAALPPPADLLVCVDVLEHVEPECLDQVLDHMQSLSKLGAYIIIGTRPDSGKLLPDGRNPHLIIEVAEWWLPRLRSRWQIVNGWFTAGELGVRATPQ